MRTTLFTLPVPLLILLTTQSLALALPASHPANSPPSANLTPLESYLDFNLDPKSNNIIIPGTFNANAHSLTKRTLASDSNPQVPLQPNDDSGKIAQACQPPQLSKHEVNRLVGVLVGEMLSLHSHGIAFPYSADTHCSGAVELTSRTPINNHDEKKTDSGRQKGGDEDEGKFNAKLKLRLTPMGRDNYGMKRVHFASLLERVKSAGMDYAFVGVDSEGQGEEGREEGDREGRRDVLEGVSGDVGFVARLVVSPVLGGGCEI